jgi:hypothetical protein
VSDPHQSAALICSIEVAVVLELVNQSGRDGCGERHGPPFVLAERTESRRIGFVGHSGSVPQPRQAHGLTMAGC